MRPVRVLVLTLMVLGSFGISHRVWADVVYSAGGDFSTSSNPNGVWSYGSSTTLGSTFIQSATHGKTLGIDYWVNDFTQSSPSITHNGTSSAINYVNITWQPGQLAFHPGVSGQNAVIRFIAPSAGTYTINAAFQGLDRFPTTTDVHILLNGSAIFNGNVNLFGSGPSYLNNRALNAGDTVDFTVGYGSNGTNLYDTTGIIATLTLVPEPSSFLVLTLGITLVGGTRLTIRKRQS